MLNSFLKTFDNNSNIIKHFLDGSLGVGGITAPIWFTYFTLGTSILLSIGGVVLLGLRIAIAYKEWRKM